MKYPITGGVIEIDEDDLPMISAIKWYVDNRGSNKYARGSISVNGKTKKFYLHRMILGFPEDDIDHINGNGLDNSKINLRIVNNRINHQNLKIHRDGKKCGYSKKDDKYFVSYHLDGKTKYVGYYKTKEEAIKAYEEAIS